MKKFFYEITMKWSQIQMAKTEEEARDAMKKSFEDEYGLLIDDSEISVCQEIKSKVNKNGRVN